MAILEIYSQPTEHQRATVGDSLLLWLGVESGLEEYTCEWFINGNPVPVENLDPRWHNSVTIAKMKPEDFGVYTATLRLVKNPEVTTKMKPVIIERLPYLKLVQQPEPQIDRWLGESLDLFLYVDSEDNKPFVVQWYKDNAKVKSEYIHDTNNIKIPVLKDEDFGLYTAHVTLIENTDVNFWITPVEVRKVNRHPTVLVQTLTERDLVVKEDQPFRLETRVTSDNPISPFKMHWVRNGVPLLEHTNEQQFFREHARFGEDEGTWWLVAQQGETVTKSRNINVIVERVPYFRITQQPIPEINVKSGEPVQTSFDYETNLPESDIEIQWKRQVGGVGDWVNLPGEHSKSIVGESRKEFNGNKYKAVIRHGNEISETDIMTLHVVGDVEIVITEQPTPIVDARVTSHQRLECKATIETETGLTLDYQWYKGLDLLRGQTRPFLEWQFIQKTDEGDYKCVVSTGVSGYRIIKESNTVKVTVDDSKPNIHALLKPSTNVRVRSGGSWVRECTVTTNDPQEPRFQWYFNGEPIEGEIRPFYGEDHAQITSSGKLRCRVTVGSGNYEVYGMSPEIDVIISDDVNVVPNDMHFTELPADTEGALNERIFLKVDSENTIGLPQHIQWYKDDKPIKGATNPILVIEHLQPSDVGKYYAVVRVGEQEMKTNEATVSMKTGHEHIDIKKHPTDVIAKEGDKGKDIVLTADAEHIDPTKQVTYQWHIIKDGHDQIIQGATNKTYTIKAADASKANHEGTYYAEIKYVDGNTDHVVHSSKVKVLFTTAELRGYVHPIPWRKTSFQWQGYWVLDEINRCNKVGLNWIADFAHTRYPREIETIAASMHHYTSTGVLESRNGYLIDGSQLF